MKIRTNTKTFFFSFFITKKGGGGGYLFSFLKTQWHTSGNRKTITFCSLMQDSSLDFSLPLSHTAAHPLGQSPFYKCQTVAKTDGNPGGMGPGTFRLRNYGESERGKHYLPSSLFSCKIHAQLGKILSRLFLRILSLLHPLF